MAQILEKSLFDPILIEESKDIREIREVLHEVLKNSSTIKLPIIIFTSR
ncbi:hypothetical protein LCGC14_1699040 [marine sediment metagenome]|uniref:Uncharacterized protein n=1 Tax=marine sediment metagenome TaxID=412755 RepID=A0A0F9KIJ9_9ZZZZ